MRETRELLCLKKKLIPPLILLIYRLELSVHVAVTSWLKTLQLVTFFFHSVFVHRFEDCYFVSCTSLMKRDRSTCIPLKITSKEYNIFPIDFLLSQGELAKKKKKVSKRYHLEKQWSKKWIRLLACLGLIVNWDLSNPTRQLLSSLRVKTSAETCSVVILPVTILR